MPEINRANRQVCDVDIRILKTKKPFLHFDTANTTTAGLSSDAVYAMAKGSRRISFPNPMEGTMTIEAQVYPFKFFALLSSGEIASEATYAATQTVTASSAGSFDIELPDGGTVVEGSVFAYPKDSYGDDSALLDGSLAEKTFTDEGIEEGKEYTIGYIVTRKTGVRKISFTNKKLPKDYYITMQTLDKDEDGILTPFLMTAYKATIQRTFELSFNSEGDPASVTLTFDLMEDKDGNFLDMIELPDDVEGDDLGE